jgi:hypothetical protein
MKQIKTWREKRKADGNNQLFNDKQYMQDEIDALRQAIEQAEKAEPFGYINRGIAHHTKGKIVFSKEPCKNLETRWWSEDEAVYLHPKTPSEDAEFLSLRLSRVAKLAGVTMPDMSHAQIADVAGTILGAIARKLSAAPTAPAQQPLADERMDAILRSCGILANLDTLRSIGRAVEAAHGIKGATK